LTPGEGQGALDFALRLISLRKAGQGLGGQAVQVLLFQQQPLLELGAAGQGKTLQETATVEAGGTLQTCQVSQT
jgi:hypothetical protein